MRKGEEEKNIFRKNQKENIVYLKIKSAYQGRSFRVNIKEDKGTLQILMLDYRSPNGGTIREVLETPGGRAELQEG